MLKCRLIVLVSAMLAIGAGCDNGGGTGPRVDSGPVTTRDGATPPTEDGGAPPPARGDLVIDRVSTQIVPPAGVQVAFRVLDSAGDPVRPLTPEDITVINDERGTPFGSGGEGGSVSNLDVPSDLRLITVLALDMSDSITSAGALDDVIDGAKRFVDLHVRLPAPSLRHSVAIVAFGRPDQVELVHDFSSDPFTLDRTLEDLRTQPSRGTTDLYGAYTFALNLTRGEGSTEYERITWRVELVERFVVLLTDGTHEAGNEETLRQQALALKATMPDVSIYSLGIQGEFDETKLIELASSEDNYVEASNAAVLQATFEQIAARIEAVARSNYVVGVCTPIALGSPSLTVEIVVGSSEGSTTVSYPVEELTGALSECDPAAIAAFGRDAGGVPNPFPGNWDVAYSSDSADPYCCPMGPPAYWISFTDTTWTANGYAGAGCEWSGPYALTAANIEMTLTRTNGPCGEGGGPTDPAVVGTYDYWVTSLNQLTLSSPSGSVALQTRL